ncbi:MAG: SPOR domain-containing protein [Acidobacteria bacterium]|nr:SPOR domain-containing protein [Acidobacteriota bacterium]
MGKSSDRQLDLVLESRQVLVLFFAIVALFGVFFSLGYIVGRNTFSDPTPTAQAATETSATEDKPSPMPPASYLNRPQTGTATSTDPAMPGTDLSFYQSAEKSAEEPAPLEFPQGPPAQPPYAPEEGVSSLPPPPPGILVQVSALTRREDAERLAALLKEKDLPAMVTSGANDSLFRVVVGPYPDEAAAQRVRTLLEQDGFRPMIRR